MVNHQASAFGNHKTVFRRLKELNCTKQYDVIVPLSYGSSWVKRGVVKMGDKLFGNSFSPITTYLPKEEYFRLLEKWMLPSSDSDVKRHQVILSSY